MRRQSIAILGGGVSGLTLARTLVALGHDDIVLFERSPEVGGKSCTVDVDGRPHDLGATMGVPIDYREVVAMGRATGNPTVPFPREQHYSLARGGPVALNRRRELPAVLAQTARYVALHASSWRGADGSGLHRAPPELYAPWSELVARHGLEAASRRTLCYRTGYGYGFDDDVPAVMHANLLRPQTLLGLALGSPFMWRDGTQPIWRGIARELARRIDLRVGTAVTKIERGPAGVVVHSRRGSAQSIERFDRLVIAFDPRDALPLLDATATERAWFSAVQSYPYATFACQIEGLAAGRASVGYLDDNMRRERAGHPMAWVKRYADRDIYICHLFAPDALSDGEIAQKIAGDVARLGGRLVAVRESRRWPFFPHFSSSFMRAGGLAAIDRWQGTSGVYLIGEALSFATMARVAEHAIGFAHRIAGQPVSLAPAVRYAS